MQLKYLKLEQKKLLLMNQEKERLLAEKEGSKFQSFAVPRLHLPELPPLTASTVVLSPIDETCLSTQAMQSSVKISPRVLSESQLVTSTSVSPRGVSNPILSPTDKGPFLVL